MEGCHRLRLVELANSAKSVAAALFKKMAVGQEYIIVLRKRLVVPPRRAENGVEAVRHREREESTFERVFKIGAFRPSRFELKAKRGKNTVMVNQRRKQDRRPDVPLLTPKTE